MKQNFTKMGFLFLFFCCAFATLTAQKAAYTFKGTVNDAGGLPLPGVTVAIPELRAGAVTDAAGYYNLSGLAAEGEYTLQFSYSGFKTTKMPVSIKGGTGDVMNGVTMSEDILNLDEVLITGNTLTSTRKQLGNSIGVVEADKISRSGTNNVIGALSGKFMGAQISQNDGGPAGGLSVRMRGPSSIKGSSDPLYIIDGVIVDNSSQNVINRSADAMATNLQGGQNRLIDINPNDIDHIEVLNGASAAAQYGSRAANGVVQIFTKKGKNGKPKIEFSTGLTSSSLRKKVFMSSYGKRFGVKGNARLETPQDRLTTLTTVGLTEAALIAAGTKFVKIPAGTPRILITEDYDVKRYDYQDDIFENAIGTDNHLSMSGGNEKSNYFASFGYSNNDGIMKNTNYRKYTGRLRYNQNLTDWATMSMGVTFTNGKSQDMPNGNNFFNPISAMYIMDNVWDINERDASGNLKQAELVRMNPLSIIETFNLSQRTNRTIGDINLTFYPFKGLSINALVGADAYTLEGNEYHPRVPYAGVSADFFPDGYVGQAVDNRLLWNNDVTATYQTILSGKLKSTTTVGYQIQQSRSHFTSQEGRDLAPFVQTISAAALLFKQPVQSIEQRNIYGGFAQETFGYNDQIFVTLAARVDGSTAFSANNQNIVYPKASIAWIVSDYWKDSNLKSTIPSAKLRASWGKAGNLTGIGAYDRFDNFNLTSIKGLSAVTPSKTLANPDVKPEIKTESEFGADLGLINNRVGLSFTVYSQRITDLLLNRVLAPSVGGNTIVTNAGEMTNKGIEVLLTGSVVKTRNISWDLGLNYSRNRNKIVGGIDGILELRGAGGAQAAITGQEFGLFYGRYYARNADGSLKTTAQGLPQPARGTQSGTQILGGTETFNADGQPSGTELRKILGSPLPDWIGSLTSDLKVKQLSFNFQFDAFMGAEIYNWNRITGNNVGHGELAEKEIKGEVPRGTVAAIAGGVVGQRIQEEHVEDGSYIKLREIGMNYNFGKVSKGVEGVTIGIFGRNLMSFDNYSGYDPETNSAGQNDSVRGDDFGAVPIPRTVGVRLNATF
jgi:TonB-linked SusC/RagA family outer membrane protein